MAKNKRPYTGNKNRPSSSNVAASSGNKTQIPGPQTPVETSKPVSPGKGDLETDLTFKAGHVPSTKEGSVSEDAVTNATSAHIIESNTVAIVPNSASLDAAASAPVNDKPKIPIEIEVIEQREGGQSDLPDAQQVQDGLQTVLPSPIQDGADSQNDDTQTLKDKLARALLELEEAQREIGMKAANEKAMTDQIDEHVKKIQHLTQKNKSKTDQLREVRQRYDEYLYEMREVRDDIVVLERTNRRLSEDKREVQTKLDKLSGFIDGLPEELDAHRALVKTQHLQFMTDVQGLFQEFRLDHECAVGCNSRLRLRLKLCESDLDHSLIQIHDLSRQVDDQRETIQRLFQEKKDLANELAETKFRLKERVTYLYMLSLKNLILSVAVKDSPTMADLKEWAEAMSSTVEDFYTALAHTSLATTFPECFRFMNLDEMHNYIYFQEDLVHKFRANEYVTLFRWQDFKQDMIRLSTQCPRGWDNQPFFL